MDVEAISAVRARLGAVGVWLLTIGVQSAAVEAEVARELEALGYGSLWFGEAAINKEAFTHAAILLAATERILVGTGIANVYARDPTSMRLAALALGDAYPGRFLLGMGVGHAPLVTPRGHAFERPLAMMGRYLDEMSAVAYQAPMPEPPVPVVLAALRARMMALAGECTDGAHPYFTTVEHTRLARQQLGPGPLLIPAVAAIVESDADRARAIAREWSAPHLEMVSYREHMISLGYDADELAGGGSDRVVDDVIAWGLVEQIRARVQDHLAAGADHVLVHPLPTSHSDPLGSQRGQLRRLAPELAQL